MTVADDNGLQTGSDNFDVTVANVAPTVSIAGAGSVNEGSAYSVTLTRNDPGTDTPTAWVIRWGDGAVQNVSAAAFPANGQFTHTYADGNANRQIQVDVVDEDGTFVNAGTANVFVANVAPTAPVSGADTALEGSSYTLTVGTVVDPGDDTRAGYSIDWGDGTPTDNFTPAQWLAAAGSFTHVFADGGSGGTGRTIIVRASDEDGTHELGRKNLTVNNVAPSLTLAGNATSNEAATYSLSLTGSDPAGSADPLSYAISWGDGSAVQNVSAVALAGMLAGLSRRRRA